MTKNEVKSNQSYYIKEPIRDRVVVQKDPTLLLCFYTAGGDYSILANIPDATLFQHQKHKSQVGRGPTLATVGPCAMCLLTTNVRVQTPCFLD